MSDQPDVAALVTQIEQLMTDCEWPGTGCAICNVLRSCLAALKGQMWQREAKEETVPNNDVIQYMLDSLEAPMKPLTKWETDFLESIGDQFKMRGSLTVRQAEILERIYNEKK